MAIKKLMAPEKAFALLSKHSIPYAEWRIAKNTASALRAAKQIGFPVALKIVSKKIVHKSDVGGVKTGIENEEELASAFEEIMKKSRKLRIRPEGILVQKMKPGTEIIIGMKKDPQFGAVVLFGLGGIFVEVLEDVSMRIAPLTEKDCNEMIKEIKGYKILEGTRGRSAANISAIVKMLMAVSDIGMKQKSIAEMDLNPVMVNEKSASVVDARILTEK